MLLATFEGIAPLFAQQTLTGATIITHGFQPSNNQTLSSLGNGDSLLPLAEAIAERADAANGDGQTVWILDYDIPGEGGGGEFDLNQSVLPQADVLNPAGELVLLFDWAPESNELSAGWGEAAGDALFSMLVGLGIVDPAMGAANTVPLHFIAHSFGAAVTSEAIERLGRYDVPVEQVTYLDPHDFDQVPLVIDEDQKLFTLGEPQLSAAGGDQYGRNYGATVWNNVAFADVYYQTESDPIPEGRPIPGAYNQLVNDAVGVDGLGAHSHVWNPFYLSTVTDPASTTGYAFSRVARAESGSDAAQRPAANFYDAEQDHKNTSGLLVLRDAFGNELRKTDGSFQPNDAALANLPPEIVQQFSSPATQYVDQITSSDIEFARWKPRWSGTQLANGDLEFGGDENDSQSLGKSNIVPGWSHHGGGGAARLVPDTGSYAIELTAGQASRRHNRFYAGASTQGIEFDAQVVDPSQNDPVSGNNPTKPTELRVTLTPADGGDEPALQVLFDLGLSDFDAGEFFTGTLPFRLPTEIASTPLHSSSWPRKEPSTRRCGFTPFAWWTRYSTPGIRAM